MSFNTDDLSLLVLGIEGDKPTDPEQPPLVNGNHLRWFPSQERGFPWHGFYLFRRESRPARPRCLSAELRRFRPGTTSSLQLQTALGRLSGARPLVFTEQFAPTGVVEVDLGQGALRFDLPGGVDAGRAEVRIGFRDGGAQPVRTCVDFRPLPIGFGPSPRTEKDVLFTPEEPTVSGAPLHTAIEQWPGAPVGLQTTRKLEIDLPCAATRVDLLLTNRGELKIAVLDAEGSSVAVQSFGRVTLNAGTVTLAGNAITRVTIESSIIDAALLHQVCFDCPRGGAARGGEIEVRALAGTAVVARALVRGDAGKIAAANLEAAGITAIEIAGGTAALVDLCVWPQRQGATFGWGEVPGFRYPLCLPVAADGYPCAGSPTTLDEARDLAFSRVTYPAPLFWDQGFGSLHGELVALVSGGPAGGAMAARVHADLPGKPLSPARQEEAPTLPGLRPLDLVYLGSLQPVVAQMLGLYFVDRTATAGVSYDYLLLADPTGVLGGSAASALAWLAFTPDPAKVDAVLVSDRQVAARPPIAAPRDARVYALPGAATRAVDNRLQEAPGNVGLWWQLPADSTADDPDRLVFYFPHRVFLGTTEPTNAPAVGEYVPVRHFSAVLVSEPDPQDPPVPPNPRARDWPPPSIALHVVDGNLEEGWYSYRVSGQDLFGRRSPLSPPASWYQWDPPPPKPGEPPLQPPWYYQQPAGHRAIHAYAVALLDKIPPPPPLGVEAWALDPRGRWLLEDEPYLKWRKGAPKLVGLRVRWRWTQLQQVQAPDVREFRIYYQPGRWNALLARTVKVTAAASAAQSDVELDLADARPPGTFAKARLRVGNDDFEIVHSQPGAKLRLRVRNIGALDDVRPAERKPCTIAIPEGHPLWVDSGRSTSWAKRLANVPYDPPAGTVIEPVRDGNGRPLHDAAFAEAKEDHLVTVNGNIVQLPPTANLAGVPPLVDHLHLWLQDAGNASATHRIAGYDVAARMVNLETAPTIGPPVHWVLGRTAREYDVFLPAPDVGPGRPFEPSQEQPTVYAQVAVSAADDKKHTKDDPKWGSGPNRYGNEGRLSPSATVFRVHSEPPLPPELPDLGDRLYATRADYHDRSYSTFRFIDPKKPLRVHVLRALDDSLFRRDWLIRETRMALDPVPPPPDPPDPKAPKAKVEHLAFFPDGWDFTRRKAAASSVNALADGADYNELTPDAWTVLALLPGNEAQPDHTALEARDRYMRSLRGSLTTVDPAFFPPQWKPATRDAAVEELNGVTAAAKYAGLSDTALRLLAALPGNEAAFTQVTLQPLEMADPSLTDERRPDDGDNYAKQTDRRAYTDTLPGRATNRYFYRALFVDGAQNQSVLSLPGPPVYLHKVEPPRAPVITKVAGGNREVSIGWAMSREAGLTEYRVYRSSDLTEQDVRRMQLVHVEPLIPVAVGQSGTELLWTDQSVPARVPLRYAITSVDDVGNVSRPSVIVTAKAFDYFPPDEPSWESLEWIKLDSADVEHHWNDLTAGLRPAVVLTFSISQPQVKALCQREESNRWQSVTPWSDPTASESNPSRWRYRLIDDQIEVVEQKRYRAKLMSLAGVVLESAQSRVLLPLP